MTAVHKTTTLNNDNAAEFERARSTLQVFNPDDRKTWVYRGMELKSEFGDTAFDAWDEWSALSENYKAKDARAAWKSFKNRPGGRTINSLFHDARQAGWRDSTLYKPPSREELERRAAERAKRDAEAAVQEAAARATAAERAQKIWKAAEPKRDAPPVMHKYLAVKGVQAHGARVGDWSFEIVDWETGEVFTRVVKDCLLVPVRDRKGKLHSLQCINTNGNKVHLADGAKQGHFFAIGSQQKDEAGNPIYILAEGFATAASVHEATSQLVLCCFDAGNVVAVAKALREAKPNAVIVIAADNDVERPGNPGITAAREAAEATGALVAVPVLAGMPEKKCDFNDVHAIEGTAVVAACIEDALTIKRVLLVPTHEEALGVAYARDCLARLEAEVAKLDGLNVRPSRELIVPHDGKIQRAAELALKLFRSASITILAAPGDETEAQRVAGLYGAVVDLPLTESAWRGWGEWAVDMLFARIDLVAGSAPAVRELTEQALEQAAAQVVVEPRADTGAVADAAPSRQLTAVVVDEEDSDERAAGHFKILGFGSDKYFFFHRLKRQVLERSRHDFTDVGLIELAPRNWWESNSFGAPKGGIDKAAAAEWIFGVAHARGFFDMENRMRGRGAWRDKGRSVFHHGDHLTVDGVPMDLTQIERTHFIYENKASLPAIGAPATVLDGERLFATAQLMRWVNPASAMLLVGWCFLAPIGGALKWRPHIWITGEAGGGKSAILNGFVGRVLGSTKLSLDAGDSSAAGIRQKLKRDALPVVLDEAEGQDEKGRERMRGILTLARGASTDGDTMIAKGTVSGRALEFAVRSMFCLGAIGALAQNKESDNSRFATLAVRNKSDTSVPDRWAQLKPALDEIEDDEGLPARLLSRGILMLPTLYKCIGVFAAAATRRLGSERYGDQYGTLLAGYWCLTHDQVVTEIEAQRIIDGVRWDDYSAGTRQATPDSAKCLDAILDHIVTEKGSTVSIRALVALAAGRVLEGYDGITASTAKRLLQDRGLTITNNKERGRLLGIIRNSTAVAQMLRSTEFAMDWQTQLPRVDGYLALHATSYGSSGQDRGHGFPLSSMRLPDDASEAPI